MRHIHSQLIKLADFSQPPGEMLISLLNEIGLNQSQLAVMIGRPIKTINEIVKGKAAITASTAIEFEKVFGISAEYWVIREARYRLFLERMLKV